MISWKRFTFLVIAGTLAVITTFDFIGFLSYFLPFILSVVVYVSFAKVKSVKEVIKGVAVGLAVFFFSMISWYLMYFILGVFSINPFENCSVYDESRDPHFLCPCLGFQTKHIEESGQYARCWGLKMKILEY